METVVSGIRPTGRMHLGNYFGAVTNFIKMQEDYNAFFFIADYHSLTTHPKTDELKRNVRAVLAEYLATGIDPEKATLYLQSDIPEIAELYLIFNMIAYQGELERCTTYKEKVEKQQDNINAGLLTYPVLMAIDIIIHKANKVPVGKDQKQHLEMTRNFVNRFHYLYNCNVFPEPEAFNFSEELIKVPGLDGSGKMGKSEAPGNAIFLAEPEKDIRKKVMRAVTDSGPTEPNSPKSEAIQNLFTIMQLVSDKSTVEHFETTFNNCTIRYGDMKKQLAEDIVKFTTPLREKIEAIESDTAYLEKVLNTGKEKARVTAAETLSEVKSIMGIGKL